MTRQCTLRKIYWLALGGALLACVPALSQETGAATERALTVQASVRDWAFTALTVRTPVSRSSATAQAAAMVGREDITTAASNPNRNVCEPLASDPLEFLQDNIHDTSIVIINESHASPRDRYFIGELLHMLRQQGFDTYAGETFSHAQLSHADVLGGDGWYSNEPMFARTLRKAKELGYRLVAYEQTEAQDKASGSSNPGDDINRREANQVENLMRAIFTQQPDAKVIIHVGAQHVQERRRTDQDTNVWMAERLKMATGRDPLTISQTSCVSPTTTVLARHRRDAEGNLNEYSPVDLYIGHPALDFREGRPAWRQAAGDKPTSIPPVFLDLTTRVIVEARPENSLLATVPTDRVLLFPGERMPLLLPPGRYRVDGFTPAGRINIDPVGIDVR